MPGSPGLLQDHSRRGHVERHRTEVGEHYRNGRSDALAGKLVQNILFDMKSVPAAIEV